MEAAMTAAHATPELATGATFTLAKGPVTTAQLVMYAGASGDFNRIHYDLPFAEQSGLGGVIAHGMLTMGFAAQLVTDWAGPSGVVSALSARFLHPVRPGDTVVLTGTIDAVSSHDGRRDASVSFEGRTPAGAVIAGSAVVAFSDANG
jgi:acyl dehydratase